MLAHKEDDNTVSPKELYMDIADGPDLEEIINLALKYHSTYPEFFSTVDLPKVINKIALAMVRHPIFLQRRAEDGKIVGLLIIDEKSAWWSNETYLTDILLYVEPEYRSFKATKELLDTGKEYAIMNKQRFEITIFNPEDLHRKERLLTKLGFSPIGMMFEMNS